MSVFLWPPWEKNILPSTQDVQALPKKNSQLSNLVPRRPVLSISLTITVTITHTHTLPWAKVKNDAVGHHSPWDLWEGMFWTVNGKDISLCSWCRPFIFKWSGVSNWPSVYLTCLSLWENIQTILRTTRLRDKPSLWLFWDGLQADPPACFNLSWELWQEIRGYEEVVSVWELVNGTVLDWGE